MSEKQSWCGYLEAGEKSAAVLIDPELDTGNPATLYMFNLSRREILEYKRSVVEAKLRRLRPAESGLVTELKAAYAQARRSFKPAADRRGPVAGGTTPRSEKREEGEEEEDASPMDTDAEQADDPG
jgi:hypothetical protein